jgi:hypothetical protein
VLGPMTALYMGPGISPSSTNAAIWPPPSGSLSVPLSASWLEGALRARLPRRLGNLFGERAAVMRVLDAGR